MLINFELYPLFLQATTKSEADWSLSLSSVISIIALLLNIIFYIIIAPRITFKFQKKEEFYKCAREFLSYLSEVVSYDDFAGVPTQIRIHSMSIHLMFNKGTAPKNISNLLEEIFQSAKKRKTIEDIKECEKWEADFRSLMRDLRKAFGKYAGIF